MTNFLHCMRNTFYGFCNNKISQLGASKLGVQGTKDHIAVRSRYTIEYMICKFLGKENRPATAVEAEPHWLAAIPMKKYPIFFFKLHYFHCWNGDHFSIFF